MSDPQRQIVRIIRRLRRVASLDGVATELSAAVDDMADDVRDYPAERPGQVYVRTEAFKRSVRVSPLQRTRNRLRTGVESNRPRVAYIIGTDTQAPIHKGRWRTVRQMVAEHQPKVRARVLKALRASWRQP